MAGGSKARRFARAMFRAATTLGVEEAFVDRFGPLARAYRENIAFRHLMITHRIPVEQKMEVLHRAFADVLTELEFEVLHLLLEQGMGIQLPKVAKSLTFLAQAEGAWLDLTVFTPRSLSGQELQSLRDRVGADLRQSLRVTGVVDPALLGGVKLRLGNTLVDGTVARRLELLRDQLV